jgi:hypothetical protein
LPESFLALLPAAAQQTEFFVASDQKRRPVGGRFVVVPGECPLAEYPPDGHRLGHALQGSGT